MSTRSGKRLSSLWGVFAVFIVLFTARVVMAYSSFGWAKYWGSSSALSLVNDIASDSSGNVFAVGDFEGSSVDFDTSTGTDLHSSNGDRDMYVTKYDSSGNFVWARTWGSTGYDRALGVTTDSSGNVYVTGFFGGTAMQAVDFDGTSGTDSHLAYGNGYDLFIVKYNADGSYGWAQTLYGVHNNVGTKIAYSSDGYVYVSGYFTGGDVDFDPTGTIETHTSNNSMAFLTKYAASNGAYQWTRTTQGTGTAQGNDVVVDSSHNPLIVGYYLNAVDFDPTVSTDTFTSTSVESGFISSYDSSGNYNSTKVITGASTSDKAVIKAADIDASNNIYLTGYYQQTIDFDPGLGTVNKVGDAADDIFVLKLNGSLAYQWVDVMGGSDYETGESIATDGTNVYITGNYGSASLDFDPSGGSDIHSPTGAWGYDLYVTALDNAGNYVWTQVVTGGNESDGLAVDTTSTGVYFAGKTYGNVDIDPNGSHSYLATNSDYGSSLLAKWLTVEPVSSVGGGATSNSTTESGSSTSSSTNTNTNPSPGSFPIITEITVTDDSATVTFLPGVGPLTNYILQYGKSENNLEYGVNPIGDANSKSFTIASLAPNTTYYFRITPVNAGTVGTPSPVLAATTNGQNDVNSVSEAQQINRNPVDNNVNSTENVSPTPGQTPESNMVPNGVNRRDDWLQKMGEVADRNLKYELGSLALVASISTTSVTTLLWQTLASLYSALGKNMLSLPITVLSALLDWAATASGILLYKNKGKKMGIVFDAASYKPLAGAFVIMFSKSGNLKSGFSDLNGRYSLLPVPDTYSMRVEKTGYLFPSKRIKTAISGGYLNIYMDNQEVNINIERAYSDSSLAMDPKGVSTTTLNIATVVGQVLWYLGIVMSGLALYHHYTLLNLVTLLTLSTITILRVVGKAITR